MFEDQLLVPICTGSFSFLANALLAGLLHIDHTGDLTLDNLFNMFLHISIVVFCYDEARKHLQCEVVCFSIIKLYQKCNFVKYILA